MCFLAWPGGVPPWPGGVPGGPPGPVVVVGVVGVVLELDVELELELDVELGVLVFGEVVGCDAEVGGGDDAEE